MANVNIKFNGKEFLLSCEDGQEEHLEELLIQNNKIDYQDSYFDTAIMDNVIEHIENPEGIINEIKRILKKLQGKID